MYRMDKQFMTNPATAGSRIYIGGLPKTVVAADLEEKFQPHGKILGLSLQTGFAFIQFENEFQAQSAIQGENNTNVHGRWITVKQAVDKTKGGAPPNRRQQGGPGGGPYQQQQQNQFNNNQPNQQPPNQQFNKPVNHQQHFSRPSQQQPQQFNDGPNGPNHNNNKFNDGPNKNRPQMQEQSPKPGPPAKQGPPQRDQPPQKEPQKQLEPEPENRPSPNQPPQKSPQQGENAPPNSSLLGPGPNKTPGPGPNKTPGPGPHKPQGQGPNKNIQQEESSGPPHNMNDEPDKKRRRPPPRPRQKRSFRNDDSFNSDPDPHYYGGGDHQPFPPSGPFMGGNMSRAAPPPVLDQPDRNDCEIIVVSKALTKYAEYIEQRLKSLGLIVDLLFPNEDVPIGRVLANISSRGCLYAILVMPQNEEHRSLTLNVLHGLPQEHRNMPIEDALILITRNFDAYMRGDKTTVETLGPGGVMNISDRHPTSMQLLLNLLAENRQITAVQYDKLLKYLQDRREVQQQHEVTEGTDQQESQGSDSKQAELQSRIMNILNKSTEPQAPPTPVKEVAPPVTPAATTTGNAPPPLLKDPSVQKALDSLLGGEMFKNMSGYN